MLREGSATLPLLEKIMDNTPYARGYKAGWWDAETLKNCGWEYAQKALERALNIYQESMNDLQDIYKHNPTSARKQAEYLEGVKAASVKSLRQLIEEGY